MAGAGPRGGGPGGRWEYHPQRNKKEKNEPRKGHSRPRPPLPLPPPLLAHRAPRFACTGISLKPLTRERLTNGITENISPHKVRGRRAWLTRDGLNVTACSRTQRARRKRRFTL